MKKLLFGLLIVVVAVLVGLPGFLGIQIEEHYQAQLSQLQKSGVKVHENSYQRGWFSSVAETRLGLMLPAEVQAELEKDPVITARSEISHGPWLSTPFSGLAESVTTLLMDGEEIFPADYPAKIDTLISFDGSGTTRIDMPAHSVTGPSDEFNFGGLDGSITFDRTFGHVNMQLAMPSLKILDTEENQTLSLQGVRIDTESNRAESGLALGGGTVEIDSFEILPKMGEAFTLNGFSIEGVSDQDAADMVKVDATYQFAGLDVGEQHYGPGELGIKLGNLPASVLLEIQQEVEKIQASSDSIEQQQMAMMSMLFKSGPKFVESDPQIEISKLYLDTPEGEVKGAFALQSIGLNWKDISNNAQVLQSLKGSGELQMPRIYLDKIVFSQMNNQLRQHEMLALEQGAEPQSEESITEQAKAMADGQIEMLIEQGFLANQEGVVSSNLNLEAGLLTINGKSIPLPAMQ